MVDIFREKVEAGAIELSNAPYRCAWFCVLKKDKQSLRVVFDLQDLNRVSIRDAAMPPFVETLAEQFLGAGIYTNLDFDVISD